VISTRTRLLIALLVALIAYAVISRLGPEIDPILNPSRQRSA